jgi:hypothetical protein
VLDLQTWNAGVDDFDDESVPASEVAGDSDDEPEF